MNANLEELVAEIINADGEWQFDDTNHTDLPIGTIDLSESVKSYKFMETFLSIDQVKIKTESGQFMVLKPIDPREFKTTAIEEYFADDGLPTHYDKLGDTLFLYPSPIAEAVTLTAGLKVHFKRTIKLFTVSGNDTQEPGLPSTHHILLAYMTALPYAAAYKQDRVPFIQNKITTMRESLMEFYARRTKDEITQFNTSPIAFK